MHCDDASRAIHQGLSAEARKESGSDSSAKADEKSSELDIHLSACEECRSLADDLTQLARAFSRARTQWLPRPGFRIRLPMAPWRRLAIAASLLLLPLAGWAAATVLTPTRPHHDVGFLLRSGSRETTTSSDREILTTMFLPESQP